LSNRTEQFTYILDFAAFMSDIQGVECCKLPKRDARAGCIPRFEGDVAKAQSSAPFQLPKDAVKKASLGQSFAEYDLIRAYPALFVETPAMLAALDANRLKSFFVGRRGTGKTAVTFYLQAKSSKNSLLLIPQLLSAADEYIPTDWSPDVHQQPFKTLVCSFKRAILDEVLAVWFKQGLYRSRSSTAITREKNDIEQHEFDIRLLNFISEGFDYLGSNTKEWLKFINRPKLIADEMTAEATTQRHNFAVLIDRLDDSWNGSDKAVVLVMALLHATVELNASVPCVQPLVFIRENVFEKVRNIDRESARLETAVVSLEWTRELLREFIERRLNRNLLAKPALGGPTWNAFFEQPETGNSEDQVFGYCQYRPRDVLIYVGFALESAQAHVRSRITPEDLQIAKKKFSEGRLKDLSDEYADNYPRLGIVLSKFYGLGNEYTIDAIDDFTRRILLDDEIRDSCQSWIYGYSSPELLIRLLYNLGFFGFKRTDGVVFKSSESPLAMMPPVSKDSIISIHPTYADALGLQNALVNRIGDDVILRKSGFVGDLPESTSLGVYNAKLSALQTKLRELVCGDEQASDYEKIVEEVLRLCFYKALTNIQPKSRDISSKVIRDILAANYSSIPFWGMLRQQYGATQIIFECKNYKELHADDFQQASYYMNDVIGRVAFLVYRGGQEIKRGYLEHIRRIRTDKHGIVLILGERDLEIFLRQALNGKKSEGHLQDLFDRTVRDIS